MLFCDSIANFLRSPNYEGSSTSHKWYTLSTKFMKGGIHFSRLEPSVIKTA